MNIVLLAGALRHRISWRRAAGGTIAVGTVDEQMLGVSLTNLVQTSLVREDRNMPVVTCASYLDGVRQ